MSKWCVIMDQEHNNSHQAVFASFHLHLEKGQFTVEFNLRSKWPWLVFFLTTSARVAKELCDDCRAHSIIRPAFESRKGTFTQRDIKLSCEAKCTAWWSVRAYTTVCNKGLFIYVLSYYPFPEKVCNLVLCGLKNVNFSPSTYLYYH